MTTITLPTELITQILTYTSVPTTFICERVSKQWSTLIRRENATVTQIWKPKLVHAFPEGCLPVLQGNENWRDVVILWFAWQSKWETTENGVVEVTEIEEGEKLRRVGDGVVRDVCDVFSANNRPWASSFCPDGRVVLSDRKDQNETTKYLTSMDSTFAETLPTRVIDNLQGCGTHRSDILALESDDKRSVLFQTWDCDDTILKLPARHGTYGTICGNVFVCETRSSETRIIFPILNPSCAIEVKHPECFCFNETLIAFGDVDHVQKIGRLRIVRIHDMKEIADIELPIYLLIQRAAKMTRFNIFLAYTDEGHEPYEKDTYAVFDLCGRRLHDLHLTVGPDLCTDVVMENCFSFEGWISADSPDPLYLSNPVDRTNLWMVMRDAMEVGRMNDGYFFVTMEYPVDGDGKVAANGSGGWVSEKYWEAEWMDGPDE